MMVMMDGDVCCLVYLGRAAAVREEEEEEGNMIVVPTMCGGGRVLVGVRHHRGKRKMMTSFKQVKEQTASLLLGCC